MFDLQVLMYYGKKGVSGTNKLTGIAEYNNRCTWKNTSICCWLSAKMVIDKGILFSLPYTPQLSQRCDEKP